MDRVNIYEDIGTKPVMDVHDYMRRLGDLLAVTEIMIKERDEALRERDEARREVCEITMPCVSSQKNYANGRGWNCFKEKADGK
jgi:hypothetical protein